MGYFKDSKEKHWEKIQRHINQDVNYDAMNRYFGTSEKAKKAFRHKPYSVIHREKSRETE